MIRIDDDFVINVDQDNYTACIDKHKEWIDKRGYTKRDYDIIGYYSSLYKAIQGIIEYKVRKSLADNDTTLGEALDIIRMANKEFIEVFERAINDGNE